MYNEIFIKDLSALGRVISEHLNGIDHNHLLDRAIEKSESENPLFTRYMQAEALRAIVANFLKEDLLKEWLAVYERDSDICEEEIRRVGIIMAGNIPLAGFHDLISVLAAGGRAEVKPSSKDRYLIVALMEILMNINSFWRDKVFFVDKPDVGVDMVIASGRSETMERVKNGFMGTPALLRGSRFSIAVINGDEDEKTLAKLGRDIFLYFGLGCRSVSTLLVPEGYDLTGIVKSLSCCSGITDIADYRAAYRYAKAQMLMEKNWFVDGGFYIFKAAEQLPPPLAVVGIWFYGDSADIERFIELHEDRLQCVVNYRSHRRGEEGVRPGEAQQPSLNEYADGVDTVKWLLGA